MVYRHYILLSLPPEPGIGLLVHFEAPDQGKPYQNVSALLDVEPVSGACRGYQTDLYLTVIPVGYVTSAFQIPRMVPKIRQVFLDTLMVVLKPVSYQDVLPVGLFD